MLHKNCTNKTSPIQKEQCKYLCSHKGRPINVSRSFPLPPEILSLILHHAKDSQSTIYSASLVCRQWLRCAAPVLYMRPKIHNTYGWATFLLTLTRSTGTFAYGNLVRSINLSNDHPLGKFSCEEKKN